MVGQAIPQCCVWVRSYPASSVEVGVGRDLILGRQCTQH